jgi:hypothetical protein
MKRFLLFALSLMTAALVQAQTDTGALRLPELEYNFGKIPQGSRCITALRS